MRLPSAAMPLLLVACSVSFPQQSCWVTDSAWVDGSNEVREEQLQVTPEMGPVVVDLDAKATRGQGSWTLLGPDGSTRWSCRLDAAEQLQQHCRFANEPGTWTVRREWQGFAGVQNFTVAAASAERVQVQVSLAVDR